MNNSNILKNLITCYIIFVSNIIGLKLYPINSKGKKIMSLLEAGMMVCFGASWPFQVVKTYKSKEVKGKTIIIVAQRISTIMNAEQIIVLEEGKVVGKGTHKQLLKDNEVYRQIALSQLSEKELGGDR